MEQSYIPPPKISGKIPIGIFIVGLPLTIGVFFKKEVQEKILKEIMKKGERMHYEEI